MPKKIITKEWISAYFNHGIDPESRRTFLMEEITTESTNPVIESVYYLDGLSNEKIELFIKSPGGDIYETLGLYSVLNSTSCPIETIGLGLVMSAAVLLVAAGTSGKRYSMPETSYMMHEISLGLDHDKLKENDNAIKHTKYLNNIMFNLLEKHTNLTSTQWKRKCKNDFYFTAEQAIEFGVVDELWSEKDGS